MRVVLELTIQLSTKLGWRCVLLPRIVERAERSFKRTHSERGLPKPASSLAISSLFALVHLVVPLSCLCHQAPHSPSPSVRLPLTAHTHASA